MWCALKNEFVLFAGDPIPQSLTSSKPAAKKGKDQSAELKVSAVTDNGNVAAVVATGVPHVAYCMMTFIVRNGLKSLKDSKQAYHDYIKALLKRFDLLCFLPCKYAWKFTHYPVCF